MDPSSHRSSEYESQADAAGAPPPGKFDYCCPDYDNVDVHKDVKLELESAQLELEAAEAMRRAAAAKRRAAERLRHKDRIDVIDTIRLSYIIDSVSPRDHGPCSDSITPENVRNKAVELGVKPRLTDVSEQKLDKIDLLVNQLELPRYEIPCFDGSPT
ncbi:unnamed protein product [Echinostoma caproni]|uniref:Rho-GAP domain-containing protein n=1 Tax=Echinostoma caproni TaxID=27848 RepID=A0A183BDG2_9TREM|nr:unnamed protein product [Echinostoma caproni]